MKIVTVIQARTSSGRLPYKVLLPLCGEPLLVRMVERVKRAKLAGTIVVATSTLPEDHIIEEICINRGFNCYRGNLNDLLDRHYQVALEYEADFLVKIPSDCPLIDPDVIDQVISYFLQNYPTFDFVSNLHPATYPDGNDVEIFTFKALKTAWENADRNFEREHTTPYIWEHPSKFKIGNYAWPTGLDYSTTYRWTIDYDEDYMLLCEVYNSLFPENPAFGLEDIMNFLNKHPEIVGINKCYAGHYWYDKYLNELTTIDDYKLKLIQNEA